MTDYTLPLFDVEDLEETDEERCDCRNCECQDKDQA